MQAQTNQRAEQAAQTADRSSVWATMIRGYLMGIERAAMAVPVKSADTRNAIAICLRDVHQSIERLLCAIVRAENEGRR